MRRSWYTWWTNTINLYEITAGQFKRSAGQVHLTCPALLFFCIKWIFCMLWSTRTLLTSVFFELDEFYKIRIWHQQVSQYSTFSAMRDLNEHKNLPLLVFSNILVIWTLKYWDGCHLINNWCTGQYLLVRQFRDQNWHLHHSYLVLVALSFFFQVSTNSVTSLLYLMTRPNVSTTKRKAR